MVVLWSGLEGVANSRLLWGVMDAGCDLLTIS
jgi:hypothetical protein